jgi:hypothetical protein
VLTTWVPPALQQQGALAFDFSQQYLYQEQLYGLEGRPAAAAQPARKGDAHVTDAAGDDAPPHHCPQWALLRFSQPVIAPAVGGAPAMPELHQGAANQRWQLNPCLPVKS